MIGFIGLVPILFIVLVVILVFTTGYVKASPDTALIISGAR